MDLKKNLHAMKYTSAGEQAGSVDQGLYSKQTGVVNQADLQSNTYLFFEEQELVLQDLKGLRAYIERLVEKGKSRLGGAGDAETPDDFPFQDVSVRVIMILQKYSEQPSLLDNMIEEIVSCIQEIARVYVSSFYGQYIQDGRVRPIDREFGQIAAIFYVLVKVRTEKNVKKYLGHSVTDLEPLIFFLILLTSEGAADAASQWESRYFGFTWLSVVLMVPFEFGRLDSGMLYKFWNERIPHTQNLLKTGNDDKQKKEGEALTDGWKFGSVEELVLELVRLNLAGTLRVGKAAASCTGVLFSRPDRAVEGLFDREMEWAMSAATRGQGTGRPNPFASINALRLAGAAVEAASRPFVRARLEPLLNRLSVVAEELRKASRDATHQHAALRLQFKLVLKALAPNPGRRVHRKKKQGLGEAGGFDEGRVPMLTNAGGAAHSAAIAVDPAEEAGDNAEVLPAVEGSIGIFLEGLASPSSQTRVMAAKNLSSVALRLPEALGEEILEAVLEGECDEAALHGRCLALGEFCVAGLLPTGGIERAVKVVREALLFEGGVGATVGGGGAVRDAACYVAWSLARVFDRENLSACLSGLAESLLFCALYDRAGTCRRAAAAAFQENVGRQGDFPHGIDIIAEMDYFSVGPAANAALRVAPFVADAGNHAAAFFNHLLDRKLFHPERSVRELAARALGALVPVQPGLTDSALLNRLLGEALSSSLQRRHGAILGLGALLAAFAGREALDCAEDEGIFLASLRANERKLAKPGPIYEAFKTKFEATRAELTPERFEPFAERLFGLPRAAGEAGLLRGKGGEQTRAALCRMLCGLAVAGLQPPKEVQGSAKGEGVGQTEGMQPQTEGGKPTSESQAQPQGSVAVYDCLSFLDDCLRTSNDEIQSETLRAYDAFLPRFLASAAKGDAWTDELLSRADREPQVNIKRALFFAIRALPASALRAREARVFPLMHANARRNTSIAVNDPEVRRAALAASVSAAISLPASATLAAATAALLRKGAADHCVDRRGDAGLQVREAAVRGAHELLAWAAKGGPLPPADVADLTSLLVAAVFEPNDRLRLQAGFSLQYAALELLDKLPEFPSKAVLAAKFNARTLAEKFEQHQRNFFQDYDISLLDDKQFLAYSLNDNFVFFWNVPQVCFAYLSDLLINSDFAAPACASFALSLASPLAATAAAAAAALPPLEAANPGASASIAANFLRSQRENKGKEKFFVANARAMVALLKLDVLGSEAGLESLLKDFVDLTFAGCAGSKSIPKLIATSVLCPAVWLYSELFAAQNFKADIKAKSEFFLFSEFPIVRKSFCEEFYALLLMKGEVMFEEGEIEALNLFLEDNDAITDDAKLEEFRAQWEEIVKNVEKRCEEANDGDRAEA